MYLYEIDFLHCGGWYTYDVAGANELDAAANLMSGNADFKITAINFKRAF